MTSEKQQGSRGSQGNEELVTSSGPQIRGASGGGGSAACVCSVKYFTGERRALSAGRPLLGGVLHQGESSRAGESSGGRGVLHGQGERPP